MSLKLKHVVTFLKITICFLLSRPFGSCVWLLKILAQPIAQQKKGMHNPKVRKKLYAPENCPTPPLQKKEWFIPVHVMRIDGYVFQVPLIASSPAYVCPFYIYLHNDLWRSLRVFTPQNWKRMCVSIYIYLHSDVWPPLQVFTPENWSKAFFDQNAFRLKAFL